MKTSRRITAALLALVMVMSLFAWGEAPLIIKANAVWDGTVATSFSSGSGTQSSPYIIKTAAQMGYFRQLLSEGLTLAGTYFKLGANLDMTGGNWTYVSTEFCGDFNGNGYTLTMDTQFVGTIGAEGRVHRLKVVCPEESSLSLLCSYNKGTIEGCVAAGTVDGSASYAGGLVRENTGTMLNVAFVGTVGGSNMDVGGLVYRNDGTIDGGYCSAVLDAYSSGKYGASSEDPVVGYNNGTVTNVYYNSANGSSSYGTALTETAMKAQSLVTDLNATNSSLITKWAMDTSSVNDGFPVIVADNKSEIQCSLSNTEGDAFICNSGTTFTIVKSVEKTCTIYYTTDGSDPTSSSTRVCYTTGVTITKDTTIKMVAYESGVYGRVRTQNALVMAGSGTEASPYQITTKGQLQALSIAPEAHFVLKNDLTFTDSDFIAGGVYPNGWQTIATFSGVLDGQGYAISNMQGTSGGFIKSNSGTISGIRFINHQLTGDASTFGPIAHSNDGLITKCYVNLNVTTLAAGGSLHAGGIVGSNGGTISYCQIDGNMTINGPAYRYCWIYVGGISSGSGTVESCYSKLNMRIISPYTTEYVYYGGISYRGYVYNSRNDGTVYFNVALDYDIYANAISGNWSYNSYGALSYTYGTSYGSNFRISSAYQSGSSKCYSTLSGGSELLESSFPDLDFTEKWMIMENGPVPQGIMNADGTCYTKTDYRRPACADGYTTYVDQNNNTYTQTLPLNGVHLGGTASCTSPANCEICNTAYGQVDSTNHTGLHAVTQQNDATYPFTYADGWYTSSNKSHSSVSAYTLTALAPVTIRIDYSVSSENNYDKLIVLKNQTTCGTYSGTASGTLDVTLAAGDTLYIKYSKDGSVSSGTDSASFALTIPESSASCTNDKVCFHCQTVVEPAWGHSYLTGVNDATYPFAYADGKFTSTNKAYNTTSSYTYTASTAVTLSIDYSVSSYTYYDKLLILKNGTTLYTYSGEKSGTLSISLAAGDKLVFRYSKTSSTSSGSNSASFAITSQRVTASCTQEAGCVVCGVTEEEYLVHSYEAVVTAPTCTQAGYTTYTCSDCGKSYVADEVAALGHSWTDATCIAPKTCATCGVTEGTNLDTHSYQDEVVAPGCLTDGFTIHTCIHCGTSYQDTVTDAIGHSWAAATCTEPRKCVNCGLTRGDALGHSYEAVVTAPTCTQVGYTTYTCSACGDSYVADEVAALGHSHEAVVTDPTCTEAGYITYTCSVCGNSYVEDLPATGHAYDGAVTAPTCTEGGYTTYTCSVCGDSYVADEVGTIDHSYDAVVTAPTCTEVGYTTYTCSVCGDSYVANEVATVSHTWLDATCTEPVRCDYCGTTRGEALGHLYETVVTEPTCTSAGGKVHTCVDCGDTYITDAVDSLDHGAYSYSLVNSVHTFACTVCGNVVTKEQTDGKQFKFNTAAPTLSDDIVMNIATTIPAGFSDPYMVVAFNGVTTTVTDYSINQSNGRYVFAFTGLNPQTMGDTFHATLYATVDGFEVGVSLDYSMMKYINSQLKKNTISAELRTALSDLVMYGQANQVYEGYKTDALLSSLLESSATLTPSTFSALDSTYNKQVTSGTKDANIDLKGVGLTLGSKLGVKITIFCVDVSAYSVNVQINGEDYTYPVSQLPLANGYTDRYVMEFTQMKSTQFGDTITVTFLDQGGNQVGRTLTYSVYTYVQKNQANADANLVNLLEALYNYGESVKKI